MNKKLFYILFSVIIIAAVIYAAYFLFGDYYYSWRIKHNWERFEKEWNKYFSEDKYGGKTPEETYNMFIDTLKKGDIESASQYFYWEKQVDEQSRLQKMKDEGKLEEYINELPKWGGLREEEYNVSDEKHYSYEYIQKEDKEYFDELLQKKDVLKAGKYRSSMIFQLNKQANIWKIYSL